MKLLKITGLFFLVIFIIVYYFFSTFTAPKSDVTIIKKFNESIDKPIITQEVFNHYKYRKLTIKKDTTLPTLVFIHGAIGSSIDFIRYLKDSLLLTKANMVSYDRIGYNYNDKNSVQESIAFERDMLNHVINDLDSKKTILIGYSYGGPIALAIQKKVKKIILIAPAVYSKIEPIPWAINLYKSKLTRWLIPKIWREASKEKISHKKDLQNFEHNWKYSSNNIISIHGTSDWIVPYKNSIFLQNQFPRTQFKLVTIKNTGHGLVWNNFKEIKQLLLNQLD